MYRILELIRDTFFSIEGISRSQKQREATLTDSYKFLLPGNSKIERV